MLGYEDRVSWPVARKHHAPIHRKFFGNRAERLGEALEIDLKAIQFPLNSRQVEVFSAGLVLLKMQDIAAMAENEIGNGRIETLAIGTLDQEDSRIFQCVSRVSMTA